MQFFEAQQKAQQKTFWLLVAFGVEVGLLSALNAVLLRFFLHLNERLTLRCFAISSGLFFILWLVRSLSTAPMNALVEKFGGQWLSPHPIDPAEIQLRNVVQEMCIAAGMPVPRLAWMSAENSINLCAFGDNPQSAVILVTEGFLRALTRDEQQAAVAHVLSHLLSGDLELNSKTQQIVGGFQLLMKASSQMRTGRNAGAGAFYISGWLGYQMSLFLQQQVCLQRCYLADARAVQWTRNPQALTAVLEKILLGEGSALLASLKFEYAHAFFADPVGSAIGFHIFSTHPAVQDRLNRISTELGRTSETSAPPAYPHLQSMHSAAPDLQQKILSCVGLPNENNLEAVSKLISGPSSEAQFLQSPAAATLGFAAVLIRTQNQKAKDFIDPLRIDISKEDQNRILNLCEAGPAQRLSLLTLSLASLSHLSLKEKEELLVKAKLIFDHGKQYTLEEILIFAISEKILLPAKNKSYAENLALTSVANYFESTQSPKFEDYRAFINCAKKSPQEKQKILKSLKVKSKTEEENLRLFAYLLSIPIPADLGI
jgi:Zn-dependent protease with chaperone function